MEPLPIKETRKRDLKEIPIQAMAYVPYGSYRGILTSNDFYIKHE